MVRDLREDLPGAEIHKVLGQARVRTGLACLCNAIDAKLVSGHFPGIDKHPPILGHEFAGIVDALGQKVRNFKLRDRVIGGPLFDFAQPQYSSGRAGLCDIESQRQGETDR